METCPCLPPGAPGGFARLTLPPRSAVVLLDVPPDWSAYAELRMRVRCADEAARAPLRVEIHAVRGLMSVDLAIAAADWDRARLSLDRFRMCPAADWEEVVCLGLSNPGSEAHVVDVDDVFLTPRAPRSSGTPPRLEAASRRA